MSVNTNLKRLTAVLVSIVLLFCSNSPVFSKVKQDGGLGSAGYGGLESVGIGGNNEYYVKYRENSGSGRMAQDYFLFYDDPDYQKPGEMDKRLTSCQFTRTGYYFVSWNTNKDGSGFEFRDQEIMKISLSNNILDSSKTLTLYAQWEPIEYTVSFSSNGGTGTMLDQAFLFDTPGTLSENQYKRAGYTFKSWNTKADGTGTSYPDHATSTNFGGTTGDGVILYAQWEMNDVKYTVNHYWQDVDDLTKYILYESKTYPAQKGATSVLVNAKSYVGFTCNGPTQQSVTLSIDSSKNVVDFYYTRNRYTITYANMDIDVTGTLPSPVTEVLYGDKITVATNSMSKKSTSEKLYITYHGNGGTVGTTGNSIYKETKSITVEYKPNGWELSGTPTTVTTLSMRDSFAKSSGITDLSPVGATSYPSGGEIVCLGNMTLVPAFTSKQSGDTKVTFPDATRNRYVFKGWFPDSSIDLDVDDPVGKGGTKYDLWEDPEGIEDGDLYAGWKYDPNATSTTNGGKNNGTRVTGVSLSPESMTVRSGSYDHLEVSIYPSTAANRYVSFISSNDSVASVSADGTVRGLAPGNAVISVVTDDGGYEAYCHVTVEGVKVSPGELTIKKGGKGLLSANVFGLEHNQDNVLWSSEDISVAEVSDNGEVTGISYGTTRIFATIGDGLRDYCLITVTDSVVYVEDLTVSPTDLVIPCGAHETVSAFTSPVNATNKHILWSSSDNSVAEVTQTGIVSGMSPGTAFVTGIAAEGGYSAKCKVVVIGRNLENEDTSISMIPGEVRRLDINYDHTYVYGVSWSTREVQKGCISLKNGVVTAKKPGTAYVTAMYAGSRSLTFTIEIKEMNPVVGYSENAKLSVKKVVRSTVGEKKNQRVTIAVPKSVEGGRIHAKSMDHDVCDVKEAGTINTAKSSFDVLPVNAGTTYIMWELYNAGGTAVSQACTKVIVRKPRTGIRVENESISLTAGEGQRIIVKDSEGNTDTADLVFKANGKGIKVSKSGYVVATVPGSSGFVTVKAGKETVIVPVTVSDRSGSCLILNKTSVNTPAPKMGKKAKTLTLKVSKPKQMSSNVKWRVLGDPTGITVRDGKVRVSSNASPGCYIVRAESDGYTSACCEVIVK